MLGFRVEWQQGAVIRIRLANGSATLSLQDISQLPLSQLDWSRVTPAQKRVYWVLAQVPMGRVVTYAQLAQMVGMSNGARWVARWMARNPFLGRIPCHRVVLSTGKVGGYQYGESAKQWLLQQEYDLISSRGLAQIQGEDV